MGEEYEDTEWRQGHLLADVDAHRLFPEQTIASGFIAIIISHDCDLTRPPESEPYVEVVFAKKISDDDGNFTHGKNSRKLHLTATGGGTVANLELIATGKATFSKSELITIKPDLGVCLTRDERNILREWLAARYRRSAFPNEFERRLKAKKIAEKLSKKLEPLGSLLFGLYFNIESEIEYSSQEESIPYELEIYVLYIEDGSEETHSKVTKLVSDINTIFKNSYYQKQSQKWTMIELTDCTEVSDHAMSIATMRGLQRWNADHLSLRADPQQKLLA